MKQHMFTGIEITEEGIAAMGDYVAQVRESLAWMCRSLRTHRRQFLH
jgi:hypothetical protein